MAMATLAVLGALIAAGSPPNFAVRTSERAFRTYSDKVRFHLLVFASGPTKIAASEGLPSVDQQAVQALCMRRL